MALNGIDIDMNIEKLIGMRSFSWESVTFIARKSGKIYGGGN